MKAIVLSSSQATYCTDHEASPNPGHIPIRVIQAGICETDLQLIQGYMGFQGVIGHEFVGIAESGKFQGQRVVGEINCACGQCEYCLDGLRTHCPHRTVLGILKHDGAFAERVWLPEENLHPVPDSISNDAAVFTEPLAAAFQIPAQLDLTRFNRTIVLGDGRLGNLCAQVLHQQGRKPLVVGKHPEKLSRLEKLGIETALLDEMTKSRVADLVVDCTGSATGFPTACRLVKPRGAIVLKTTVAGDSGPPLPPVVIEEITVVGSRCGPFVPALQALERNEIDVESLITSRFPLSQGETALDVAARKDQLKVLLEVSPSE